MTQTHKQFIQHPSAIPLEYCLSEVPPRGSVEATNNAQGGLSFHSDDYIAPQQWLHLSIPLHENYFETDALVCWCQPDETTVTETTAKHKPRYHVGVQFSNRQEAFSARMVEQVCYIEEYKKNVKKKEGRELSSDQAAAEWIEKYAEQFPPIAT